MMFQNHDGYTMAMVRTTWQLCNKICDVLHRDNFVAKTDVNLIEKTTNLATHGQVFNIFLKPFGGWLPPKVLYIYMGVSTGEGVTFMTRTIMIKYC